ncbi:MAG: acyltransferase domain-containing protein [Deltaproteobacteria bacterium]|nr:MAG: acyltransferase domain-containing protein [Deltaproteobacteria bacterium]
MTKKSLPSQSNLHNEDFPCIAVVGMSARFPGAPNTQRFWENVEKGVDSIRFFSEEELRSQGISAEDLQDPNYIPARGVIEDYKGMDAPFFQISAREAELLDPQQRMFLESAWASLEDAGYDPSRFDGKIGVFAGSSENGYFKRNILTQPNLHEILSGFQEMILSDKDSLATRTSYKLGLTGPSLNVQSACSTSLVAVQLACLSLLNYQCDMALAGGASLKVPTISGERFQEGNIFSPDGRCRAFDANAAGAVGGDGVGVVVLRRLEDALEDGDCIRAVIRSSAINNDGNQKVGYTAPGLAGQEDVIASALEWAEVPAESITYIEAHGTATPMGDPIEVAALTKVFREQTNAVGFCALGTVKTNIGHLNAASGVAGLIKAVLACENRTIPPSLHFESPNPHLQLESSPFFVNTEALPWQPNGMPRRVGVSSFGVGGTNVHVVVEEAPPHSTAEQEHHETPLVLGLSAQTSSASQRMAHDLKSHLEHNPELALVDVVSTWQQGRREWHHRRAIIANNTQELSQRLATHDVWHLTGQALPDRQRPLVFLFPAQGGQRVDMGRKLYDNEPIFRNAVDACFSIIQETLGYNPKEIVYPTPDQREQALAQFDDHFYAGPALFSVSYGLAQYWLDQGVQPAAVLGHSTGEYVAATIAGILSLEDALRLFLRRASLFQTLPAGGGLRVSLPSEDVLSLLHEKTYLALENGPSSCIVTGTLEAIDALEKDLQQREVPNKRIRLHEPAHSPLLESIVESFQDETRNVKLHPPTLPYVSGVTGTWLQDEEATDPSYWVRHMLQPVRFKDAFATLQEEEEYSFLEVGPYRSVEPIARYNVPDLPTLFSVPDPNNPEESNLSTEEWKLRALAQLWCMGGMSQDLLPAAEGRRIPLPTYPFERREYWLDPPNTSQPSRNRTQTALAEDHTQSAALHQARHPRPEMAEDYVAPRNKDEAILVELCEEMVGISPIGIHDPFPSLGADSLITLRITQELEKREGVKIPPTAWFGGMTIAHLANFMDITDNTSTGSSTRNGHSNGSHSSDVAELVPLQPHGDRPPLFLVHPAAGVIFPYIPLAHHLPSNQPVFALQASGLDGRGKMDRSCQTMASRYIQAIQSIQPQGPYHIAGYSFGSYVCYEMARQLQQQGESVAFLGLIDEAAPLVGYRPSPIDVMRILYGHSGFNFLGHFHDYASLTQQTSNGSSLFSMKGILQQAQKWSPRQWKERWGGMLQSTTLKQLLPEEAHFMDLEHSSMTPMFQLFLLHTWLLYRYNPPPYEGNAVLFKSEITKQTWYRNKYPDEDLGWQKLIHGHFRMQQCIGDHMGMIREPHVTSLANALTEELERTYHDR